MEHIGATDLNGTTNNDRTNYFEDVPTPALDYTLWLESDRMGHLLGSFDEKTLNSASRRKGSWPAPRIHPHQRKIFRIHPDFASY